MARQGYVPVYLPDRTVVGRALISDDGKTVTIDIPEGDVVQELMAENLIGLSVVYQGAIPATYEEEKPKDG